MSALERAIRELTAACAPLFKFTATLAHTQPSIEFGCGTEILNDCSLQNSYEAELSLSARDEELILAYAGVGEIRVDRRGRQVIIWLDPSGEPANLALLIETHLLALLYELHGALVFHGGAVGFGNNATAFLAPTGTGKSSTCALAVANGGTYLGDDLIPTVVREDRVAVYPVASSLKLRTGSGTDYLLRRLNLLANTPAESNEWLTVSTKQPTSSEFKLKEIYCLRTAAGDRFQCNLVHGHARCIELLENLFIPKIISALGLEAQRFALVSRIAELVPLQTLQPPSGVERADQEWPTIFPAVG